jgi:hypothetical protein
MMASLDELMQALNFTAHDLEANRRGELSARQRAWLTPNPRSTLLNTGCGVLSTTGVLVACPGLFALVLWQRYLAVPMTGILILGLLLTALTLGGLILGVVVMRQQIRAERTMNAAMRADAQAMRVRSAVVTVETDEAGEHCYAVGDTGAVMLYLENDVMHLGERCIAYFVPHSNLLIAAEPLPEANGSPTL